MEELRHSSEEGSISSWKQLKEETILCASKLVLSFSSCIRQSFYQIWPGGGSRFIILLGLELSVNI